MTTLVGTQTKFSDALIELVELEYDAAEAYRAAIERIQNEVYKETLSAFLHDHERHIQALSRLIAEHGGVPPRGPDLKQHLLKGKVIAANVMSDETVLKAMGDNDQWPDARDILAHGFADEKRHKVWLEETVSRSAA